MRQMLCSVLPLQKNSRMKRRRRDNATRSRTLAFTLHRIFLLTRRRRHLFHLLYAFSSCLILLFIAFSLLSNHPPLINHHRHSTSTSLNVDSFNASEEATEAIFRLPVLTVYFVIGQSLEHDLWTSRLSKFYYGCSNASTAGVKTHHNRYLLIATSGGLNQQRTGITDAVVAAYILNATLVVPKLDQKSFWKDTSDFAEIFDVNWFISFLSKDVKIIKQLPLKGGKAATPYYMRVPRKCTPKCYQNRVLPVFKNKHAIQLGKFDYRLSNKLDMDLQKLRCRVNYHALKFTDQILQMGKMLVGRMKMKSKHFIALHLRFESDMLAFSGCYYGGGEKERIELGLIRKRWKTLHVKNPDKERRQGRCPLTPEEVGLMLRALGFGSDIHMYVASGEVYGGEETLAPLKALFPNLHSKETLASKEELAPFLQFSSRMAALDFIVCDESDVFVTNNNGNMARMLAGRRKYFGHKPTIRPNAKKLYKLFLNRYNMSWEEFTSRVHSHQIGFMGEPNEVKPGRGEFHENPSSCICESSEAKAGRIAAVETKMQENNKRNETGYVSDEHPREDDNELDWFDRDYVENEIGDQGKGDVYMSSLTKTDQPELELLLSD
ncbi:protein ROOT HAIR SPECIFIC 17 isoform X2 [Euphorbia lathyris]|uniref:protein ROOT HAIR SPECIFIC 17 isoform X2 n=1 Tax=Euphorbia lathyris TaxID=212925 RepID=UPI003313AA89